MVTKFGRLSEFGTDISGQCVIILLFYFIIDLVLNKKIDDRKLLISLLLIVFCITLKTYFTVLALFLIYKYGFGNFYHLLKNKKSFFIITSVIISFFILLNILSSGCMIFPLSQLCFENLSWAMPIQEVESYNQWFQIWSKALAGPNFRIDQPDFYLENFNWVKIWIKNYSSKFLENILILIFIGIIFLMIFKKSKFKFTDVNINMFFIYSMVLLIFLLWFTKHPTLRYGGYSLIFLIISMPMSIFLSFEKTNIKLLSNKFNIIILISFLVFSFKNLNRIYDEIDRKDEFKFINFPYFYVPKVEFDTIDLGNKIFAYKTRINFCWDTPAPCTNTKSIKAEKKFGFIVFNNSNE